jgi:hypothetical protein
VTHDVASSTQPLGAESTTVSLQFCKMGRLLVAEQHPPCSTFICPRITSFALQDARNRAALFVVVTKQCPGLLFELSNALCHLRKMVLKRRSTKKHVPSALILSRVLELRNVDTVSTWLVYCAIFILRPSTRCRQSHAHVAGFCLCRRLPFGRVSIGPITSDARQDDNCQASLTKGLPFPISSTTRCVPTFFTAHGSSGNRPRRGLL